METTNFRCVNRRKKGMGIWKAEKVKGLSGTCPSVLRYIRI